VRQKLEQVGVQVKLETTWVRNDAELADTFVINACTAQPNTTWLPAESLDDRQYIKVRLLFERSLVLFAHVASTG
jgi:hypothetical protein